MNQFMTLILVPRDSGDIVEQVRNLLAPYVGAESTSEMDYWQIGGLYDGVRTGDPSRVESGDQTALSGGQLTGRRVPPTQDHEKWLANNRIAVVDLPPVAAWEAKAGVYAVVTLDGLWHDLWEITPDAHMRKEGYFQDLIGRHRDCWAITVLCHRQAPRHSGRITVMPGRVGLRWAQARS